MKSYAIERFAQHPNSMLCITDFGILALGGPHRDQEVENLKITHWRETAGNRGNDFSCDRREGGMPADPRFEQFVDELANPHIQTFQREYDKTVPGCRGEVLRQLSVLESDPRVSAVTNTLLTSCMQVFEYCSQLPAHIELN